MSSFLQTSPYLREQRQFPSDDIRELARQTDQAYVDIANKVNARTIGLFGVNFQIITGEQWYLQGEPQRQQSLRQLFTFSNSSSIDHGIDFNSVTLISKPSGSFTDGTNWYGVIYGSDTAIAGQLSFYITSTQIVFKVGAGSPTISSGIIVLEWLSQF